MNKVLIIFVVFGIVLALTPLLAADTGVTESSYYELVMILDNSKTISSSQVMLISDFARDLSTKQLYMLYESYKKSATLPFTLNFLLGAGIGSFVQGDITGGVVGVVWDLIALSLIYSGYLEQIELIETLTPPGDQGMGVLSGKLLLGSVFLLGSKIYQWSRPFSFAKKQNNNLARSLDVGLAMMPIINKEGDIQMRVAATLSF